MRARTNTGGSRGGAGEERKHAADLESSLLPRALSGSRSTLQGNRAIDSASGHVGTLIRGSFGVPT